ncbi:MAG: hypothetical protein ACRD2W_21450 [Acidimicrobiales bacterium]
MANWKLCHEARLEEDGAWFVHTKGDDGQSTPIEVTVRPACRVAFGQGLPPGQPVIDINHGWSFWMVYDALGVLRRAAGVGTGMASRAKSAFQGRLRGKGDAPKGS